MGKNKGYGKKALDLDDMLDEMELSRHGRELQAAFYRGRGENNIPEQQGITCTSTFSRWKLCDYERFEI